MATLEQLQERYSRIEADISSLWPNEFRTACADCRDICCRPHMADEVLQSFWLSELAKKAHGKNWHLTGSNHKCAALNASGCLLKAGKPPFCFAFYCDALLDSVPPVVLISYLFLSLILSDLCRLDKKKNLQTMTAEEVYQSLDAVERKIENAERHVALYRRFQGANSEAKAMVALQMLAEIPQILSASSRRAILSQLS